MYTHYINMFIPLQIFCDVSAKVSSVVSLCYWSTILYVGERNLGACRVDMEYFTV